VSIHDVPVTITLTSRFPSSASGTVTLEPERDAEFRLSIRIPRWTAKPVVSAIEEPLDPLPGAYLDIQRTWRRGDVVTFSFPFEPVVHIGKGSNQGRVAVTAGPLVLALDQADNPDIKDPRQVALRGWTPAALQFEPKQTEGKRSWPEQISWAANLVNLGADSERTREFRGILRPYFDAGSWAATPFCVWLRAPEP
jgi:DUF1680 family protein